MKIVKLVDKDAKQITNGLEGLNNDLRTIFEKLIETTYAISDSEAKKLYNRNLNLKNEKKKLLEDIKLSKKRVNDKTSVLAKKKIINRILKMLLELKSKGGLTGRTFETVRTILMDIDEKDFQTLRKLEEKIYTYV